MRRHGLSGQGRDGTIQRVAQIMQRCRLQPQRQSTDVQVYESTGGAVLDFGDKSAGQTVMAGGGMHGGGSMADHRRVAAGDGLPARQQGACERLHHV